MLELVIGWLKRLPSLSNPEATLGICLLTCMSLIGSIALWGEKDSLAEGALGILSVLAGILGMALLYRMPSSTERLRRIELEFLLQQLKAKQCNDEKADSPQC